MKANAMSAKKLTTHPASLAVPNKVQRIRRHPLFKNVTEQAAVALAKHCTEKYFDPNTCLLEQNTPAKHWLLPIQGTFKVYQSASTLSPLSSRITRDGSGDEVGLNGAQFRATMAAITLAAEVATTSQGSVLPGSVDVTNGTFHGIDFNENYSTHGDNDARKDASSSVLNAPLGLEDALGAAGHLQGGGECDGYRYSVHSPGYTHVSFISQFTNSPYSLYLMLLLCSIHSIILSRSYSLLKVLVVNGNATAELINEHPSLRDAIWRFMAASMLLRNPQWVQDATQASVAMAAANAAQGAMVLPAGVSARDLALSIVRPHQSKGGRSRAGYLEIVARNPGNGLSPAQQGY